MPNNLIIVESPAKARTINKFLGNDYIVVASMGHVRDLPEKELGFDPSNHFEPRYEITKDKKKTITDTTKKKAPLHSLHRLALRMYCLARARSLPFRISEGGIQKLCSLRLIAKLGTFVPARSRKIAPNRLKNETGQEESVLTRS